MQRASDPDASSHRPFVAAGTIMPEFTPGALVAGTLLGILFGASSLYLVLKVGMTVSASIPVAVLSITLFRGLARAFGIRPATILENNIVQTTGSAGESVAFGIGVTIPALLLLGFDLNAGRVMTVGVLGGLLGVLMMIPLRRAFVVRQHGTLPYPEGTACASVLVVGERGGSTAATVFGGFILAFAHKLGVKGLGLWKEQVDQPLYTASGQGLRGGVFGGELAPELLGVGYIIGPRIASIMLAGGVLAYLVLVPLLFLFGDQLQKPLAPENELLIRQMSVSQIRNAYILYIGAGAVATGGIISMFQAMPLIAGSLKSALRDLRAERATGQSLVPRTERDLPLSVVVYGSLALVLALAAAPGVGLGFDGQGLVGAACIVLFGFLFVTVSSRLTGEIGSSSNPISGMTVATLLLTCLLFVALGLKGQSATLTALMVAAVVCIAASNGGTTSQDLKTGFLVGATPTWQQIGILIGTLSSALVMGWTLLLLNQAGTIYSRASANLPDYLVTEDKLSSQRERAGGQFADDPNLYHVWHVREGEIPDVLPGKYLVDDQGKPAYLVDPAINGRLSARDDGRPLPTRFDAPKTRLMALIIDGIMNGRLPWELVLIGGLIAVTLELVGVPALPFAVGVYLPIQVSVPIFAGGAIRWLVGKLRRGPEEETDSSPGVLLSSGYIAGGAIAGVLVALLAFAPGWIGEKLHLGSRLPEAYNNSNLPALVAFLVLAIVLGVVGVWSFRTTSVQPPNNSELDEGTTGAQ